MTGKNNKENRVFNITHSGELLIWLIIILVVVSISSITFMKHERNDENDYQVFLNDVDGLIVGSPVRMLGIEVGHVAKIKPVGEEVYVKFILTNPDVYIPQGTAVTVEFSGMAGSKSLELYLPDENSNVLKKSPVLVVNPPKRLHDALGLLNEMYKKLNSIIYTSSSFGKNLDLTDFTNTNKGSNFSEFLKFSDQMLDESNQKAQNLKESLDKRGYRSE